MLSYQSVTFDKLKAPMLGVGAFWARSMPKVFDDFFNLRGPVHMVQQRRMAVKALCAKKLLVV
jgi:hypothetical protein